MRQAFAALGGTQTIDAIRHWVKLHAPEQYDYRRIGTIIRGCSDLEKARERHRDFPSFLHRMARGEYKLAD